MIKVNIYTPELSIQQNKITLFANDRSGFMYITLTNVSNVSATYKWKKLSETWHYVSEVLYLNHS